jgi:tryptophan-rich sensory protein
MGSIHWIALLVALAIPQIAGGIGAIFTSSAVRTWYATLTRPDFAPPNWVFGPVWTTLFILMGIASYLVWSAGWERSDVRVAIMAFAVQLMLNVLWSLLFFGARNPGAGDCGEVSPGIGRLHRVVSHLREQ